ncbi:nucleoside-specific channel-forming protein Tsx [Pluralibacter gergoviae]|uniref:Nucleoside-specific channel-forming protein Tsx n=1 Tax=Pluralibacter gergoviae TaxID=61647 RepID=A0AAI9DRE0_PLUGE|nr:nucleoside-specific channel-forming protein Tsx [Pluralibacter gergoviae]AIR03016.1 nucleoside-specific channel-forming protein Tsx [Pluralibacter gergoviae]EKV0918196.1 nucleoside-specific channel-forming protein Tsx [Pluralibacter gergoviae]EKV0931835.1 nucleoside-specific channel-forming protein Tsx [Pluralibacter gergoviae]EKV6248778.1 nucleoside-specific channel-forming protein Tsx [Pluralibacter gergoviae]EKV9906522.1 nucleoside-specific channel-forming protein Tsx [Pluralibacter gerg
MKTNVAALGSLLLSVFSFNAMAAESNSPQYLSDWWHQSVNVVGSYHTRFGPQIRNDTYLEYTALARKDWFDFYGYADLPVFFGGNSTAKGIWNKGSPLFVEIEPRFSIDKLTDSHLGFGPFKEWYFANNYIFDAGRNSDSRQSTWYMGLGTDVDTHLPMSLSLNVYAKYQWKNYGATNENEWDGYRFKIKYFVPITPLWGGNLSYVGFTNIDWGSSLGSDSARDINGNHIRSNNSVASTHILTLNYAHWHYAAVARYWHHGGQWADGATLNFGNGNFTTRNTGWGGYFIIGYDF